MVGVHKADNRFTAENRLYKSLQLVPRGKHLLPVEIRKAVNRKENIRGLRRDLSVFALPPSSAAGTHLMPDCINDLAAAAQIMCAHWERIF